MHFSLPAHQVDEDTFEEGNMFDGSSIEGWKSINASDMIMMPDTSTAVLDPFTDAITMNIRCDIVEPDTMQGYERDPRTIAKRAESYLQQTGIADQAFFGPEPEFFVGKKMDGGNMGHRPGVKGGYFPVPPVDSLNDLRANMCMVMDEMGVETEVHHHEVGTAGQCEIGTKFDTLVKRADGVQILKYVVHNVAHHYGRTATFMPKPIVGDNGSGMHVHQSLFKNGENMFAGDQYGGLSETALHYIGGVIKHAHAINAFSNASTNSYKRLVPGFEAPVMLAYSARNRSASVRIPWVSSQKARRIEVRFPDPTGNPYLTFSALMMAGLDGIQNKIHPGDAMDKDLYDLPPEEEAQIPKVASSLDQALAGLDNDRAFLTAGGVFTDDMIDAYIELKMEEVTRLRMSTHPVEFDMYYSL
ncbi:UNVERIFIED_CONTAM: hypothetical protein GTU68_031491 [Idotea baltica]|nr:hypothetical protein [Idotea baltica]